MTPSQVVQERVAGQWTPKLSYQRPENGEHVNRHVRHGWVHTINSAQGATSDRVLAHVESYRANIVDARAVYVAISRARELATLYTNSRADLTEALGIRDGAQVGAIDQTMAQPKVATIATPTPVRAVGDGDRLNQQVDLRNRIDTPSSLGTTNPCLSASILISIGFPAAN